MRPCCYIVPPHLLKAIAESSHNPANIREAATHALTRHRQITAAREKRLLILTQPRGYRGAAAQDLAARQSIVPDVLLKHIAESDAVDEATRANARHDLEHIQQVHDRFVAAQQTPGQASDATTSTEPAATRVYRAVYDAKHSDDEDNLPGALMRAEGQNAVADQAVDESYDQFGNVLKFYKEKFNWNSIDNQGMNVIGSCHFGSNYENAFWDPDKMQMVFGDGHDFLGHFTSCTDVICHEMTHAVTEHTSPLDYQDQSGALNEHISDTFGIMCKQMVENETADKADWLIGEGCLMPGVKGVALRSMKEPGTAYNDPKFGKDPQPNNFKDYKDTWDDNGGVHLYSGIPNKAFYLSAVAFGGYSWEKAGQIWWKTMNCGRVPPRCTFLQFADVTVDVAQEMYGDDAAKAVRKSWDQVGVSRKH